MGDEQKKQETADMADDPNVMRPCPFCGGQASVIEIPDNDGIPTGDWEISCDNCLAGFMEPTNTKQESINKWNTRA